MPTLSEPGSGWLGKLFLGLTRNRLSPQNLQGEIDYDGPHIKLKIESEINQEDTTEVEKQDEEQRKEDSISSIVMREYGIKLEPSLKLEPDAQMETDVEGRS